MNENKTFISIKSKILEVVPVAQVYLFGSRANENANAESDWDILILLEDKPDRKIKQTIHHTLFPLSVQIFAFINTIIVSQDDWNNNPSYYSLHQSIAAKNVVS